MKGAFLLDVAAGKRERERERGEDPPKVPSPGEAEGEFPRGSSDPLEEWLARWHGNWRGSSSAK